MYQTIDLTPKDTWVRSQDSILTGVSSGMAEALGVDVWLIRFLWLAAVFFFGTGVLAYVLLSVCLPRADQLQQAYQPRCLGVCLRLANKLNMEVGLLRLICLSLALVSLGTTSLIYIILHLAYKGDPIQALNR